MSSGAGEAVSPPQSDAAGQGATSQTPGALLQQERVRRGLSLQQSAEGLHLDVWIIEAIESNQFLALGAPVYAKGYLRKYAVLLGLAPDVIVSRYEALSDTPVVPTPIPVITTTPPPRPKWPKYLGWALAMSIAVAVGFVAFEFFMRMQQPSGSAPVVAVEPSMPAAAPAPTIAVPAAMPASVEQTPASVANTGQTPRPTAADLAPQAAEVAPARETPPTPPVSPARGDAVRMRLEFSEASWVEVYDAAGQRLLYDVGQPGRARSVEGVAPLNVVIGVASAVSVQVNDKTILIPRRANRDSARFRIAADGTVQ